MRRTAFFAIVLVAFTALIFSILKQRSHSVEKRMAELMKGFSTCLPDTLKEEQKREVRQILRRFRRSVSVGTIARKDRNDVINILDHYVNKGAISQKELSVFMAKVSYYTFRQNRQNRNAAGNIKAPDHPLLQATSANAESTAANP